MLTTRIMTHGRVIEVSFPTEEEAKQHLNQWIKWHPYPVAGWDAEMEIIETGATGYCCLGCDNTPRVKIS